MPANKLSIEEMRKIAINRGGFCLSDKYINNHSKLKWKCRKGHIWQATPHNIKTGTWCKICGYELSSAKFRKKITKKDLDKIAHDRGGSCLSGHYKNAHALLQWQCKEGHKWNAPLHSVQYKKYWCPFCSKNVKHTIEKMRQIAKERGGKCLSTSYTNANSELEWQCSDGHTWKARPASIRNVFTWCPICADGLSERICRSFFENIFSVKFPNKRPSWLVNRRGNQMELDGYNEKLQLAFEYQGKQHYANDYIFMKKIDFENRKVDDETKRIICKRNNVTLIEVPYTISYERMHDYIISECRKNNIPIPEHEKLDYREFKVHQGTRLRKLKKIAQERGGKCLSETYFGIKEKLRWQCKKGHIWEAVPSNIVGRKSWCPVCAGKAKIDIGRMKQIAEERGGKCLSNSVERSKDRLKWQCREGHIWEATPCNVQRGSWCPYCSGRARLTITEMQNIASKRGGICLSKKYLNAVTKLTWQCKKGHIWEATPNYIKNGSWCKKCKKLI